MQYSYITPDGIVYWENPYLSSGRIYSSGYSGEHRISARSDAQKILLGDHDREVIYCVDSSTKNFSEKLITGGRAALLWLWLPQDLGALPVLGETSPSLLQVIRTYLNVVVPHLEQEGRSA